MVRLTAIAIKLLCFLVLFCLALLQLQYAFRQHQIYIGTNDDPRTANSRNARLLTNLGKQKHLFEADLNSAVFYLQKALIANPLYVPAWLALAVVRNDQGEKPQSRQILSYAHHLTTDIKRWRWEKVLTAYQLGQTELLPVELSYIVKEIRGKSKKAALQLAFNVWPESAALVDNLGQENLTHLFSHAVSRKDTEKTLYFYRAMDELEVAIERKNLLRAIDMLLRNGEAEQAGAIWRTRINPDSLIHNGDFSQPFTQTAFGWRKAKHPSVALSVEGIRGEPIKRATHIRFKGWDNINYHHLSQIIPLEQDKTYRLSARVRTEKLTTDQRPYFEIYGYKCKNFVHQQTEQFPITADWQPIALEFTVPKDCATAVVRLRRKESTQIDSKIAGNLWISDVSVQEIKPLSVSVVQPK